MSSPLLDPAEVEALARATETEQDAALFRVAAFTGLRLGELRALRWRDVDFGLRLVHVRRNYTRGIEGSPKSGRVRSVPLIDQAAKALDALSRRERFTDDDDLVCADEVGGHLDDWQLRRRFHAALGRAGLKPLRLHDLRHTFGTLAVQAFPLSDVQAFMGHADIATTMIYVHHVPQHDAAGRLSRLVADAETLPTLRTVSGHGWDTVAETDAAPETEAARVQRLSIGPAWIRNQGAELTPPRGRGAAR